MPCVDSALLQRAIGGETSAIDSLIHQLRPLIERQLLRYPVTDEDRRDLLQVTLLRVMRSLASFRGDASFATWLFRVTSNEAFMLMRAQQRHRSRVVEGLDLQEFDLLRAWNDDEHQPMGDARVAQSQRDTWLRNAVAGLSEEHRDVVFAHYHLDLGLQEIALRFELTESAVRSRLHRARVHLRAMLADTPLAAEAREATARERRASNSHHDRRTANPRHERDAHWCT